MINHFDNQKFLTRFNSLLERDGRPDAQIADALGISRDVLSKYKTGVNRVKIDVVVNIAHLYDVSIDFLLGCTDTKSTNISKKSICKAIGLTDDAVDSIITLTKQLIHHEPITEDQDYYSTKPDEFEVTIPEAGATPCHYAEPSRRTVIDEMLKSEDFTALVDLLRKNISERAIHHIIGTLTDVAPYHNSDVDLFQLSRAIRADKIDLYEEIDRLTDHLTETYIEKYAHVLDKAVTEYALRLELDDAVTQF